MNYILSHTSYSLPEVSLWSIVILLSNLHLRSLTDNLLHLELQSPIQFVIFLNWTRGQCLDPVPANTINFPIPSLTDDRTSQCPRENILVHISWTVMLLLTLPSNWGWNSVLRETSEDKTPTSRRDDRSRWWWYIFSVQLSKQNLSSTDSHSLLSFSAYKRADLSMTSSSEVWPGLVVCRSVGWDLTDSSPSETRYHSTPASAQRRDEFK